MKKLIGSVAAVALFAAPALADVRNKIMLPREAYNVFPLPDAPEQGERGPGFTNTFGTYNNLQLGIPGATNYLVNNVGRFVGDDMHLTAPIITGFVWLYTDNGPGSHTSTVALFANTANDAGPVLGNTLQAQVVTSMGVVTTPMIIGFSGLPEATANNPNGFWGISVTNLPGSGISVLVPGSHVWMGINSTSANPGRGGVRFTQFAPHIGDSHDNTSFSVFLSPSVGSSIKDFNNVVDTDNLRYSITPEPAVAGLLALGGLMVLRRRRA